MSVLVDTNVLSELTRPAPNPGVLRWASQVVGRPHVSVIVQEEIYYGLSWRPNSRIQSWLEAFFEVRCVVLPLTPEIARYSGRLRGSLQARGETRTQADMLIAATAAVHGLTLVTRNAADFHGCNIALLDPFS